MTEAQLLALFKEFSLVDEVNIIKDRTTRASRGCCFLICPSRQEADKAVNACHNKTTLPGDILDNQFAVLEELEGPENPNFLRDFMTAYFDESKEVIETAVPLLPVVRSICFENPR